MQIYILLDSLVKDMLFPSKTVEVVYAVSRQRKIC